jgi:hypothetical protein
VQVKRRLGAARAVAEQDWWLAVVVMVAGRRAGRGMAGGDGTGVTVRAGGVMAMCQSEVASRGRGGVPWR